MQDVLRMDMHTGAEPLLIGIREAARELGIGRDTVYQLVREGRLRSVRVSRKVLIPRVELRAFVEREAS
jgi:excisionase family DNA binding protein